MKILLLAPQPFFQERGTPIAVRLAAEVLAKRPEDTVTLFTYAEGSDIEIPNVSHRRVRTIPHIEGVGPGFSWKKIYYDIFFFFAVLKELWNTRRESYDLIHAVEESVFIAWILKPFFGIPFIYDMDSSLSLQLTEKFPFLNFLLPFFKFMERVVIRGSIAVVPVCDALAVIADEEGSRRTLILRDISLLDLDPSEHKDPDIRKEASISGDKKILLYVGNLEKYQGIDLLLEGFAEAVKETKDGHLVIIGGSDAHIENYRELSERLEISPYVSFLGPRPVAHLNSYLKQADILTSPRTLGNNTPMKIYSYLHSGIPILATALPTHTQVLTSELSELTDPTPQGLGKGIINLLSSHEKRDSIGRAARAHAEEFYTFEVFERRLNELYDGV